MRFSGPAPAHPPWTAAMTIPYITYSAITKGEFLVDRSSKFRVSAKFGFGSKE